MGADGGGSGPAAGGAGAPPIELVREGMAVVDAAGARVGTVTDIRMADPRAATTAGNEPLRTGGVVGDLADALTDADRDRAVADTRLRQHGFIAVDAGLLAKGRYARADQIAGVAGDTVTLTVAEDGLAAAGMAED